ncbi:hypothetical protein [Cysteiniphilum marinum]|nr:hypothetical protein [Cysteiniphilum marinum]
MIIIKTKKLPHWGRQCRKNFQPWLMTTIDIATFSKTIAYAILDP